MHVPYYAVHSARTPDRCRVLKRPLPWRARHVYCPIILRERSAAKLSRFWRCAQAKKLARHKRARLRLATLVNPYVRGFLARVATRTIREERCRRQSAMFLVSFGLHSLTAAGTPFFASRRLPVFARARACACKRAVRVCALRVILVKLISF